MLAPWLRNIQAQLAQAHECNRLHHAVMLHGLKGTGKQQLAAELAHALLCEQPAQLSACGGCKSCLLVKAGSHPDKLEIGAESTSIGVDEIRELGTFVNHSAQQNGNKVVVIFNAEKMTTAAANALLKTLEEPNLHRYLLISCSDLTRLPATIASRCFKQEVNVNQGLAWLKQQGFVVNEHPWLAQFEVQPYMVVDWFDNQIQDDVDLLYRQANLHPSQWQIQEISALLSKRSELVVTFSQFLMKQLMGSDVIGEYSVLTAKTAAVLAFNEKIKTVVGTNILLSLLHLQQKLS
jgi:DNA polymerase-3 subunit delta'